jgi:hypothetical protein
LRDSVKIKEEIKNKKDNIEDFSEEKKCSSGHLRKRESIRECRNSI